MIIKSILLLVVMVLVPIVVGYLFSDCFSGRSGKLFGAFAAGQMLMWCCFQIICVPLILKHRYLREVTVIFGLALLGMIVISVICFRAKNKTKLSFVNPYVFFSKLDNMGKIIWAAVVVLFVLQVICSLFMTYADGDDAFYIALATASSSGKEMYNKIPYTGSSTTLPLRYGLAPFPMWISMLSYVTGIKAVVVAHLLLPLVFLPMTYGIFYMTGGFIVGGNEKIRGLFLLLCELFVLYGDYSSMSAENFMIARSRQGKAALCSIIIPFMFLLICKIVKNVKDGKKIPFKYLILLFATNMAGLLCSTLSVFLCSIFVFIVGVISMLVYRRIKPIIFIWCCYIPSAVFGLLYIVLK